MPPAAFAAAAARLRAARRRSALAGLALAAGLGLAPGAASPCPPATPLPATPNNIELGLGATNANAAVGQGRLTATLSRCGELTSVKWPGPSYYDQLSYLTSNAPDARAQPHNGAFDSMGAFAGVVVREDGVRTVSWLRDPAWRSEQSYTRSTAAVARNAFRNDALGLEVVQTTFVLPGHDVLTLHYEVTRLPGGPHDVSLLFYSNLAPSLARVPFFPLGDTALDHRNDHALLWDESARALLHYRPGSAAYDPALDALLREPPSDPEALRAAVQDVAAGLGETVVYLALGARGPVAGFQAGYDEAPLCTHQRELAERALVSLGLPPELAPAIRLLFVCDPSAYPDGLVARCRSDRGWSHDAPSAFADAADGALSGSPVAACQANGALEQRLHFRGRRAEATLYLAAGATREAALGGLAAARGAASPEAQRRATEAWWDDLLAPAILPDTADERVLRFARRSLVSLVTATDAASDAIVASVAAQPPYGLDWPRDGAFLNRALDVAGYHDRVTRHNRFYARVQRKVFSSWSLVYPFSCPASPALRGYPDCVPPGTWEMNYYGLADAVEPGGPISFEIDTTGLTLWTLWDHAAFLDDPVERSAYLADVCPAIGLGVDALADCRDPATGLPCPASEDDNLELTQGLQSAETVLLALRTGVEAAADCGFSPGRVATWQDRADELDGVILERFRVDDHFEGPRRAWMIWPVRFRPYDDPLMASHGEFIHERSVVPLLKREALRGGYNGENVLARAVRFRAVGDAAGLAGIREDVSALIDLLSTPDTGHMAEFAGRVDADLDGDGVAPDYRPENDVPHVWQQAFLYLAAMEAWGPRAGPAPRRCDVDGDDAVDRDDVRAILASRRSPPADLLDPRDADEDGHVTAADARACVLRCDDPGCRPAPPPGCGLLGMEAAALLGLWRRRRRRRGPLG